MGSWDSRLVQVRSRKFNCTRASWPGATRRGVGRSAETGRSAVIGNVVQGTPVELTQVGGFQCLKRGVRRSVPAATRSGEPRLHLPGRLAPSTRSLRPRRGRSAGKRHLGRHQAGLVHSAVQCSRPLVPLLRHPSVPVVKLHSRNRTRRTRPQYQRLRLRHRSRRREAAAVAPAASPLR
jgi:hypothetical protein